MFRNREDAARQLAAALQGEQLKDPLVLAIPCGGVVVGATLAHELRGELDVVLSRKLHAPDQPELAIGAMSEDGSVYLNPVEDEGVPDEFFHQEKERQRAALDYRAGLIRRVRAKVPLQNRVVVVADDGIATGSTMIAALQTIRAQHPARLIVAVPVVPADRVHELQSHCDKLVSLVQARHFWAVGQFYDDFPPVDDEQVVQVLKQFTRQKANSPAGET